jgi:hypothetical protein
MKPGEIGSRLRQALTRRIDSFGLFPPHYGSGAAPDSGQSGQFFFVANEISTRTHLIRDHVPGFERSVLEQAEQILHHQFPLLGYGPQDYGKEIDWQLDIVSGKKAALKPWPKIDYLDFNEVGDSKVTWELSRHQFMITLAKAWLLTGEERFIAKLNSIYYDWHRKNPYPLGINWASSLEVAFRSLSWIWVRELLAGCEAAYQLRRDITTALAFNAWYIQRYLSTYFSPNTHLQGEAVALFFIGTLYPSLSNASIWRDLGRNILLEHALTKVLDDGAYFERSTYYHVYALDFFVHARILATRNCQQFPGAYDDVMKRMLEHLSVLCQAGPPPRLGDDDGGRVFDGRRNEAEHLRDPLAIGAALYGIESLKPEGVAPTEEMLWLLGEEGLRAFAGCRERKSSTSAQYNDAGIYILHTGGSSQSQLALDAGPLGGGSGGHGHADALSLNLNLDGESLIVDPGTFRYAGSDAERNDFRATHSHNTATVDNVSQAEPRTAFSWFRWPEVEVETSIFTPEFEFISASHNGYTRLTSPVTHRRIVFGSREGYWLVMDQLEGEKPHDYAIRWHMAPGSTLTQVPGLGWVVHLGGRRLHLLTHSPGWLAAVESGWFSPAYGMKLNAPVASLAKKRQGSEIVVTVLCPQTDASDVPILTSIPLSSTNLAYRLTNGDRHDIFMFSNGASTISVDDWESDARFLYGSLDVDGNPSRVILIDGSVARYRGETVHDSFERAAHTVWRHDASVS